MELRARATQQNMTFDVDLDPQIEDLLVELIIQEMNYHIQTEKIKREMEQMKGFSTLIAFQIMDFKKFNYLDWDAIYLYLKHFAGQRKELQPTKRKMAAIFRRLDLNADQKIAFNEFAQTIKPVDVYFTEKEEMKESSSKNIMLNSMEFTKLKKQLSQERQVRRSQERTRPLRTFKTLLNSRDQVAIKEMESPIKSMAAEVVQRSSRSPSLNNQFSQRKFQQQERQQPSTLQKQLSPEVQMSEYTITRSEMKFPQLDEVDDTPLRSKAQTPGPKEVPKQNKTHVVQPKFYNFKDDSPLKNSKFTPVQTNKKKQQQQLYKKQQKLQYQSPDSQTQIMMEQPRIEQPIKSEQSNLESIQMKESSNSQYKTYDKNSEYSPVQSSLQSQSQQMQRSLSHIKLQPKRLDSQEKNKIPSKDQENKFQAIRSKDINQTQYSKFSIDTYSPDKFASDISQIQNLKTEMRYTMEKQHKNYPFSKLLVQILNSLRVIENEKQILYKRCLDFNLLDAFKAFDVNSNGYISILELTTGLFDMQINHTQAELCSFMRYYDISSSKKLKFSDFSKAFLPFDKEQSVEILKRAHLAIKNPRPKIVFQNATFLQYGVLWRVLLKQHWEIDNFKRIFGSNNCFDFERVFFDMDPRRKGFIDRQSFKTYLTENGESANKISDDDVDLIFNFFNRKETLKLTIDDFVGELLVY